MAGSRITKPAETRYSPVEGETLAVTYALNQCKKFIIGCPNLVVAVDHQALVRILNDRSLDTISNPRLVRLKEKTLPYDFKIVYIPGVSNLTPDFGYRYPSRSRATETDEDEGSQEFSTAFSAMINAMQIEEQEDENEFTFACPVSIPSSSENSISWTDINKEAAFDEESSMLKDIITRGFPKNC